MKSYDYWYRQKEEQDKLNFKIEVMDEVRFMVQTALEQIKKDIVSEIRQEIDIQISLLMDGKRLNNVNIGDIVMDEVLKHLKSSI